MRPVPHLCIFTSTTIALTTRVLLILILALIVGCGGGGSSVSSTPPLPTPTPVTGDFSLQIPFNQITIQQRGVSQFLVVDVTRLQGFSGPISISLQGLPAGVNATANGPTTLPPGSVNLGVVFSISAASSAVVATNSVTAVGTSGTLTHSSNANLIVRPAAPFHLDLSTNNATLSPGSTAPIQVTLVADQGSSPIITLTTLPPPANGGVQVAIPPFGLTTTQPNLTVTLNAELIAQPLQNFPLTFIATETSTNQTSVSDFALNVNVPFTKPVGLTGSSYVRTDEDPTDGVYDPVRKLVFTTINKLNEVRVFSSVDRSLKAVIPAPFPQGIDLSADGNRVYVGSNVVSQITVVNPDTLQVVQVVPGPVRASFPLAPGLDFPRVLLSLASGKVLIMAQHEDTSENHTFLWDPTAGTIVQNDPPGIFILETIARSADRTKALAYGTGADINNTAVATYDVVSDTFAPIINVPANRLTYNPDGSRIAGWSRNDLTDFLIFDGQLNQLASVPALSGAFSVDFLFSVDGKTLYVANDYSLVGHVVAAFDAQTLAPLGIIPDLRVGNTFDFKPFAIDEAGMIFRGDQMGLDFVDASSPGSLSFPRFGLGSQSVNPQLVNLSAPTAVTVGGVFTSGTNRVFFGDPPASPFTTEGTITGADANFTQVTVPPGKAAGAANMTITRSDGWYAIAPDAVSFGPEILFSQVGGPASGGAKTTIFGYGFVSASTQVTIGGRSASNVQITGSSGSFPIPLNTITFNAPPGSPGSADITITTARGSVTIPGGYKYLNSAQIFPVAGRLNQIIYDQTRQNLYITNGDHNRVEVFSLTSQTFLSPIAVGTNPIGIAQTPDGALLAVANEADGTVSVIDPDQAKVVNTFSVVVPSDLDPGSCRGRLFNLTPVKPHKMLVEVDCTALLANGHLRLLDLGTGSFNCSGVTQCDANGIDIDFASGFAAMTSSKDGSKVLLADLGTINVSQLGFWDVDANQMLTRFRVGGSSQISVNADANTFVFDGGVFDSQLRLLSISQDVTYVDAMGNSFNNDFGTELNAAGSLLFFPQVNGSVDIFDLHRQRLALRINLPEPLPVVLDAMALDETGTKMFLISATGITIAQLAQAPLSIGSLTPGTGPAGTLVTVRGSGIQAGAKVTFGSSQVSSTFVDINTLRASLPLLPPGPVRVTITNPDGTQYSLDAAFTVN
jgi:DNA-binding beta-propeller fold protein YncE